MKPTIKVLTVFVGEQDPAGPIGICQAMRQAGTWQFVRTISGGRGFKAELFKTWTAPMEWMCAEEVMAGRLRN